MNYSVIVPAHNEGAHIEASVNAFIGALPQSVQSVLSEVILVENGSRDNTAEACRRLAHAHPDLVRVLSLGRGSYGEAIKRGMIQSTGTHLSILECDFLDADFVARSIAYFEAGKGRFIVASKRHPESIDGRPFKRRLLTLGFNLLLNVFLRYPGSDTHGLKSIEAGLAKKLCALAVTTDEVFQTEIVLIAWRLGNNVEEFPIRIEERRAEPVSVARRFPKVLTFLLELRRSLKRFPPRPSASGHGA